MSRFFIRPENIKGNFIYINGDEAHHALDVMRLKKGDEVVAFDGLGNEYAGRISETKRKSLVVSIEDRRKNTLLNAHITLAQSIPKREKMDYIIQKCTELGVRAIIPMISERTIVKIDRNKEGKRRARWIKIATEASKQCGRSDVPDIKEVSSLKEVLSSGRNYSLKIMPTLIGKKAKIADLVSRDSRRDMIIFIGPEGGFSPEEVKTALENKVSTVSLGPYTLRSDTAAIAALAILNYVLENS